MAREEAQGIAKVRAAMRGMREPASCGGASREVSWVALSARERGMVEAREVVRPCGVM
jgi:hypothetical protein